MPEKQQIRQVNGLEYILTRKSVKNINLRVYVDGRIKVSANSRVPLKEIDAFVERNTEYIKNLYQKAESRPEMRLIPQEFSNGTEFYFLGKKRVILLTQESKTYLNGNTLYLSNTSGKSIEKAFSEWLSEQAAEILFKYVDTVYKDFKDSGVPYPQVVIKILKSEWGNCYPQKEKITLNLLLLATPPECIYYVVVHEFSHFLHPNHSKHFWAVVSQFVPDYKEKRKQLRQYDTF